MPMKINPLPPKEILEANVEYNSEAGVFTAKTGGRAGWKIGEPIGTIDRGYLRIRLNGKYHAAHRIAWLLVYGSLSENDQIDHIDGNRSNNKILNLRLATHGQNCRNIKIPKHNRSGIKGVHWSNHSKKWRAQIRLNGKRIFLGEYTNKEDAHAAYCDAAIKLHGEFANIKPIL